MSVYVSWLCIAAALMAATTLVFSLRRGLPLGRIFSFLTLGGVLAVAGARALHVFLHPGAGFLSFRSEGLAFDGALMGLVFASLFLGTNAAGTLLDAAAPGLGIGLAAARIGCWANGCCLGAPTDVSWGVPVETAAMRTSAIPFLDEVASTIRVHPYPIYEGIFGLLIAVASVAGLAKFRVPGRVFFAAVLILEAFRIAAFGLRTTDERAVVPPWAVSLGIAIASGLILIVLKRTRILSKSAPSTLLCDSTQS